MRRRELIAGFGSAAAWPVVARAQQGDRVRRIGVLMGLDENDPEGKRRYSAFTQALADLGWTDGRNVRMELRWGGADTNRMRALAQEFGTAVQSRYWITSSAVASSVSGMVRPRALAVLRLMTNSNLTARITGKSKGFRL